MTEGSRPSPKSAMKVVMNSRVIMVTVEHYFSCVRLLLTKNFRKPITDHQLVYKWKKIPKGS